MGESNKISASQKYLGNAEDIQGYLKGLKEQGKKYFYKEGEAGESKGPSIIKIVIFLIIIVISVLISVEDIIAVGAAAIGGCALDIETVGIGGALTSSAELGNEIITQLIQDVIIAIAIIFLSGGSQMSMAIRVLIIGICSLIDLVVSALAIFLPCVGPIIDTGVEIITEIIQNGVLLYSFYIMFAGE